ncbi:MAG TPA: serine--tRNA ligase [Acetobacteraceae bacterium]|nr:serine--tRNA ligase [Acetobacteraceae bacterium]
MHDIAAIRRDPAAFDAAMARRGALPSDPTVAGGTGYGTWMADLDARVRKNTTEQQELQAVRNDVSKRIGMAKKNGQPTVELEGEARAINAKLEGIPGAIQEQKSKLDELLKTLPNILDPDVPNGPDETANVVLHQHGEPRDLGFPAKQHFEIGEALGLMDFSTATKLAGSRFTVLKGALARLERALGQWMIGLHTEVHGYTECAVPLLVNRDAVYGVGQLPKFEEDLFKTTDGRYLIPTAEVPLTNFVAQDILPEDALPLRLTALTPCFRSEAGSAGRDTRGMLRQHQFQKVELVSITRPEDSAAEHERMTRCAERVLTELGLTRRRVILSSGDTGFSSAKTYDLEVWLPGQAAWREISSCSNCRDFQARRMNARYRPKEGKGTTFVHTLNGSGVAVGRALIAVLETYQQANGGVAIPEVLRPFMGGMSKLG